MEKSLLVVAFSLSSFSLIWTTDVVYPLPLFWMDPSGYQWFFLDSLKKLKYAVMPMSLPLSRMLFRPTRILLVVWMITMCYSLSVRTIMRKEQHSVVAH